MTEQIPTPTPEQVQQWLNRLAGDTWRRTRTHTPNDVLLAACAAEWGADQELDACCEWVQGYAECGDSLRAARRPKPKNLAEEALEAFEVEEDLWPVKSPGRGERFDLIRRALERLQELEGQGQLTKESD